MFAAVIALQFIPPPDKRYLLTSPSVRDAISILFLSVIKTDNKEYRINDEASKEIWNVLKLVQSNKSQNEVDHIILKNSKDYIPVYLYLSETKAAIRIALLCESIDGKLFLSNSNYTKFYPMPEKYAEKESFDSSLEGILEQANR